MRIFIIVLFFIFCEKTFSQATIFNPHTDMDLLEDFHDRKLGMFIHWMVCHSEGRGDSWSIGKGKSKVESDSITMAWNPVDFNAKKMVKEALDAGAKYIVVISKHHDGFAIWDSKYSDFDLEKSKFKTDILKELGEECRRNGLLFGIYYSIADIHYAGWEKMPGINEEIITPIQGKEAFIQFVKNQTKELIDNYNPDILWFDGHWLDPLWGPKEGKMLYDFIKSIKTDILVTRLAVTRGYDGPETFNPYGYSGDFFSMEAKNVTEPAFIWEACTSVSYPVYAYEKNAKLMPRDKLLTDFSKVICANGNFLLNVGPDRQGTLPSSLMLKFHELTSWIKTYQPAVYGTKGGPYVQGTWGGSTYAGNKIFFHLRDTTVSDFSFTIPKGYKVKQVNDLKTGKKINFSSHDAQLSFKAPISLKADIVAVVEVVLDKDFKFVNWIK